MNRILASVASDFGKQETPRELKQAIIASEGRTILAEVWAEQPSMYPEVTSGELAAAFGADLILLKALDTKNPMIPSLPEMEGLNPVQVLRKLTGTAVGISMEVTDALPLSKQANEESIQNALKLEPDFLALTAYAKPEATSERILNDIALVRKHYDGMLMVNPVVTHGRFLNEEDLLSYVEAGADLIVLAAPGSVPGIREDKLAPIIELLQNKGAIVSSTISTSQEGSDEATIREIALSAKRAGVDCFNFGDAGACGIASPEAIHTLSLAVRGKRHTYIRMARSANR